MSLGGSPRIPARASPLIKAVSSLRVLTTRNTSVSTPPGLQSSLKRVVLPNVVKKKVGDAQVHISDELDNNQKAEIDQLIMKHREAFANSDAKVGLTGKALFHTH